MNRDTAIALMIQLEGGESNLKGDPGGHTKYGITQYTLNSLHSIIPELPTSVENLTSEQAAMIYRNVQWASIRGDDLPRSLACLLLNAAVNMGEPTAIGLLQNVLGVVEDRHMGPVTLEAVKNWRSPYMPGQTLAEEYAAHVGVKYASLYVREGQFELGWLRRLFRVYTLAVSP